MPSLNSLPVSLSEILEARGGPLRELEIWALLCQCAETLQDLLIKGEAVGDEAFRHIIMPNCLMIRDNGTIMLMEVASDLRGSLYLAPEMEPNRRQFVSDTAFEKMFVYSLGRTLQVASEFGLTENEVLSISYDLDSLLQAMSERNAAVRLGLMHILEACTLQASQHSQKFPHTYTLSRLYKSVLSSSASSSFCDSTYGSAGSRQSTLSAIPGRARRPRPHVRHRRENQKSRSRSRSRSRSNSPRRSRGAWNSGFVTSSQQSSTSPHRTDLRVMEDDGGNKTLGVASNISTAATDTHFLNTSLSSTESDRSELRGRYSQAPPYAAAHTVEGLLGLRQGSPAYQKYIQLKERQIRLKQARLGQAPSALNDVRSRLMTPTLLSHEMLDNMSENRSMSSLMSYTLGTYKPDLHAQYGSAAAVNYGKDVDTDTGSQLSLMFNSGDYIDNLRAEELLTTQSVPVSHMALLQQDPQRVQRRQPQQQNEKQIQQQANPQKQMQHLQYSRPLNPSTETVTGHVPKQREYYGSQYIFESMKPAIKIALPLADNLKNVTLLRKLTIVSLTGQKLEVILDPSSTGQQLFDTVIPYLDFDDFFFFGLTYMSEGEHFFLDTDTKLHKVAPDGWKDGPKGQAIHATFTLYVRVKFYPESLTDFRHASSYHLLYLQLRRDVLEERVTCDFDTLVLLAGLAMQAEYGDHNRVILEENIFMPEHYFPSRAVRRFGASSVKDNAMREHKNCTGIPDSQAEIEYIKHVRHLPEYGIHFHKLFKTKSNTDTFMWVGLSKHSLVLAEPESYGRSIVQDHPWNSILKISFNKRRFSIQPKMEVTRGKPPKINFYTSSYRKGRYLLQFSTEQHKFQIRMRTRPSNMETLSGNMRIQTADAAVGEGEIREGAEFIPSPTYVEPSQMALPDDEEVETSNVVWEGKPSATSEHPLQYRNPPPYQPPRMAQILGGLHVFPEVSSDQLHASIADLADTDFDEHQLQMLLDMSSNSSSQDSVLTSDRSEDNSPQGSPKFPTNDSKLGRCIFEATLEKEDVHGIGLTIIGGETTNSLDLGIFVKSVVPGGPAERDGRIMPGDRLIAIGGISLEGKQHHEAVTMIRDSGPDVTLLVSQIRPPGTIKKRNLHDEQAEFEKKLRNSMMEYNKSGSDPTFSKHDISGLETLLRFDDFVENINSSSDSDNVHKSDEKIYMVATKKGTSASYKSDSKPFSYPGDNIKPAKTTYSTQTRQAPTKLTKSNIRSRSDPEHIATQEGLYVSTEGYSLPKLTLHPKAQKRDKWHRDVDNSVYNRGERSVNALEQLREEQEINLERDREIRDWSSDTLIQNSDYYSPGRLTKEDREHLQLLGDIAALEADDSSSDSDFDTAIKKMVKGANHKTTLDGRVVNPVSPNVIRMPAERDAGIQDLTSIVTYEVILEGRNNSLGIITNTPDDPGFPKDGVYVKEIVSGSSAEQGNIIAPGDKILEVAGQSVNGRDCRTVQTLLDTVYDPVTVKVSRSLHRDALVTGKPTFVNQSSSKFNLNTPNIHSSWNVISHELTSNEKDQLPRLPGSDEVFVTAVNSERQPSNFRDHPRAMSISKLITSAPKGRTKPLDENLPIVPPPPPLVFTSQDSESNTQSDMDSDILDSSRSDPENGYNQLLLPNKNSGVILRAGSPENTGGMHLSTTEKEDVKKDNKMIAKDFVDERNNNNVQTERDTLSLAGSTEFNQQLVSLQFAMDKMLGSEAVSSSGISQFSDSSASIDSVIKSTNKVIEERRKLARQSKLDSDIENESQNDDDDDVIEEQQKLARLSKLYSDIENGSQNDEHDDDDDVVIPNYGKDPAADYSSSETETKSLTSTGRNKITEEDTSVNTDRNISKMYENQASRLQQEPKILEFSLEKNGTEFGFTVAGGRSTGGCYIKHLVSGSAVNDGRLRPGDKILKVNGRDMTALNHVEAVTLLRKLPNVATLLLLRYPLASVQIPEKSRIVQPEMLRIELFKTNVTANLGLRLVQKEIDGQSGIFVQKLRIGGTAHKDGRLLEGDQILQANGVSFIDIPKSEALSVLREANKSVQLVITRSDNLMSSSEEEVYDENGDQFDDEDVDTITSEDSPVNLSQQDDGNRETGKSKHNFGTRQSSTNKAPRGNYVCPRTQVIDVPVIMSQAWLRDLSLLSEPNARGGEYIGHLLQSLTDLVQAGEHSEEFTNLNQMTEFGSSNVGKLQENKSKNRYRNVLPFDEYRVKLLNQTSDYINASHINMKVGNTELNYIACQGPTPESTSDFWIMVWQEKVNVIVMLTQVIEGGKVKCHAYWPQTKDVITDDGSLVITLVRSYQLEDFIVVQMRIEEKATMLVREVTQIQYNSWPDHGAPDTALPLLKLLQVSHLFEGGSPAIVHCSAGIGRTGTFIATDTALATIEQGLELDLYQIVHNLRTQRHGMIQTTDQYLFCYTACIEALLTLIDKFAEINLSEQQLSRI